MRKILPLAITTIAIALAGCVATPEPVADASDVLPLDPAVTTGALDNGLRYYIRRNTEPENRASLRLAVNVGSVQEDDDQLGLAHFLEHMAFNGTESFTGNQLISFLESLGIQFGPDVNAYTSFDETVYELSVPTDDAETFDTALQVLTEWASALTLDPEEIEKERGVIVEEWRFRRGAAARMRDVQFPILFGDSRYASRLPIGDVELIQTFDPSVLERFYRDWYRPDLMAVIAVGDFDPDQMEQEIIDRFEPLENPVNPRERPSFEVPDHEETRYAIASDPETSFTTVNVYVKRDAESLIDEEDYRGLIMGSLFTSMMNDRLEEITRQPDAPFLGAGVSSGSFVRTKAAATISAAVEGNAVEPALQALATEIRRVQIHGFTESELERAKLNRLRAIEQSYRERDNQNSAAFAEEYVRTFLRNEASPGIEYERELHQRLLPGITLAEVNALADLYLEDENRVVVVSAVERDDLQPVSVSDLTRAIARAEAEEVAPYEEDAVADSLLPALPSPGAIISRTELDAEGAVSFELSNGSRVVLLPTEYRADQVLLRAFRPGGTSTASLADFRSAQYATSFVDQMGYGAFGRGDLDRFLAGRAISLSPTMDTYEEGLSGSASVEDLETMLQLLHLKMTQPREDRETFAALVRQFDTIVANQESQPQYQLNRRFSELYSAGNPRTLPLSAEDIPSFNLDAMLRTYESRFGNAHDFTFVFVGTIDEQTLLPLVEQYIASLPSTGPNEGWVDVGIRRPVGTVSDTIRFGIEPISEVVFAVHGDYEFSQANNYSIRALERLISIRMQEVIREDESGTYGVGVQAQFTTTPVDRYGLFVTFRSDPERIDELTNRVVSVLEEIRDAPPSQEYVSRVQQTQLATFEERLTSNQFWLGQLVFALQHDRPIATIRGYTSLVNGLTAEDIYNAAQRYLDLSSTVQVTLLPQDE